MALASAWLIRKRQRDQTEHQLHPQDHEDREVGAMAGQPDARIEDAAIEQQAQADEANQSRRRRPE